MPEERLPPQNLAAEQSVIGSILLDKNAVVRAIEILGPDSFYRDAHRFIFEAAIELFDRGEPIDLVTVTETLRKSGKLDAVGGSVYVADLLNSVPTAANIEYYAKIVEEKAILRRMIEAGTKIVTDGFSNPDDQVYIPLTTAQHFLSGDDYVTSISVAAKDQASMPGVQAQINNLLIRRHKISDPTQADFSIMNQTDIANTASSITNTFTILLSSIAGISLLVGGIGIMNMMLTTVTERTREIGLRKAVGIRKIYINLQFLAEAVLLTFLGGALGIILGWIASLLVSKFVSSLTTEVSWVAIFLAFGVSTAVGIIFGFYPARKAAAMSPIDALRYE